MLRVHVRDICYMDTCISCLAVEESGFILSRSIFFFLFSLQLWNELDSLGKIVVVGTCRSLVRPHSGSWGIWLAPLISWKDSAAVR